MKIRKVVVPDIKVPIPECPGFAKKLLADYKLDLSAKCPYSCKYCSSNMGSALRWKRKKYADLSLEQLGEVLLPGRDPNFALRYGDIIGRIEAQLATKPKSWGERKTLQFGMLVDNFDPISQKEGITREALDLLLDRTSFRIRVLTKNSIVGSPQWIEYFAKHRDRVVVGLSIGTLDNGWAKRVEVGTSLPTARLKALRALQDAGVPTYGMCCPIFPDALVFNQLERLIDMIRPDLVEHFWAEPYNDRQNWRQVRDAYQPHSFGYRFLTEVYENRRTDMWSRYATEVYTRIREKAEREGWLDKLRYLLYERDITVEDCHKFVGLKGVLLQDKPEVDGTSQHLGFALMQKR